MLLASLGVFIDLTALLETESDGGEFYFGVSWCVLLTNAYKLYLSVSENACLGGHVTKFHENDPYHWGKMTIRGFSCNTRRRKEISPSS